MFFYSVEDKLASETPAIVPIFYFNSGIGPMNCQDLKSESTNRVHALVGASGKAMLFKVQWSPKQIKVTNLSTFNSGNMQGAAFISLSEAYYLGDLISTLFAS